MATFMRLPGGDDIARRILVDRKGSEFDPAVVERFLASERETTAPARADSLLGTLLSVEPEPGDRLLVPAVERAVSAKASGSKSRSRTAARRSPRVLTRTASTAKPRLSY